ncbi:MAG TPA: bi-domain-containing oxidoreductase [Candidatus Dormibacteraeota bacterium]|nr:bi-domain-containing oxidoreductase [Candidatus Dormibacteraeota bacterium]
MRQVLLRRGRAVVEEVPVPSAGPGTVLVRTAWSVLSAGTERAALRSGEASTLLERAADPSTFARAIELLRREGAAAVWDRVRAAGEGEEIAPGYSASGIVHEAGPGVLDLPPGTRLACAGAGRASHAEWICVPRNLAVSVPEEVPLDEAAFTTLGSIALQGVRRSGIQIGECAVVLGIGLIGLLTAQILRAAGARVVAFDPDPARAARGRSLGFEAYDFAARDPTDEVARASRGLLADAVLVCAHSSAPETANLAMRLARRKGRVVIVGDVRLDLDRSLMYEKELDLLISTSYGPGRYDPSYEDKGTDYPAPYVRFTLNRNMIAFLDLVRDGRVAVRPLIDRVFPLQEAAAAYEEIDRDAPAGRPIGVLLRYAAAAGAGEAGGEAAGARAEPGSRAAGAPAPVSRSSRYSAAPAAFDPLPAGRSEAGVGICGAGGFVKSVHLPLLKRAPGLRLRGVATASPLNARQTARRFGMALATTDLQEMLRDDTIDLVLVGTRHHLHASQTLQALRAGRHVLVEKPLCLDEAEIEPILEEARRTRRLLAVGFNRRYSPLVKRADEILSRLPGPTFLVYRVNALALPPDHWVNDPAQGGGRILGECCHFLDLILHLTGGGPVLEIQATALPSDGALVVQGDSFAALLDLPGGSRAVLAYTGLGDAGLPKERLEIFKGGAAIVLDDFTRLEVAGKPGGSLDLGRQDKGFARQWEQIGRALLGQPHEVIGLEEIGAAMRATFALGRAVRGQT